MKVTLKETIGTLRYNSKEYGPGDRVEMTKDEAAKIAHHLVEGDELFGEPKPKPKELDEPGTLV